MPVLLHMLFTFDYKFSCNFLSPQQNLIVYQNLDYYAKIHLLVIHKSLLNVFQPSNRCYLSPFSTNFHAGWEVRHFKFTLKPRNNRKRPSLWTIPFLWLWIRDLSNFYTFPLIGMEWIHYSHLKTKLSCKFEKQDIGHNTIITNKTFS